MKLELLTPLPPGAASRTRLARLDALLVVLRELVEGEPTFRPPSSPRVLAVQDIVTLQGRRFGLFEYAPGATLEEVSQAFAALGQPVPVALAVSAAAAAARALHAVRPAQAHGGLSDQAVLLGFDGEVRVMDFGAPRPGRFRVPGRPSASSDVFSLGAALHAALTRYQGPYFGAPAGVPPVRALHPGCSPAVQQVVERALSLDLAARPVDLGQLADELEAALGEGLEAPVEVGAAVSRLFPERARLLRSVSGTSAEVPELGAVDQHPTASHPVALGHGPAEPTQPRPALSREASLHDLLGNGVTEETRPGVDDTHPGAAAGPASADEATDPGRAIASSATDEDTAPRGPPPGARLARHTSEAERHRARGQERVATPPVGTPVPLGLRLADLKTVIKRRPAPGGHDRHAETDRANPAVVDAWDEAPPRRWPRVVLGGLLVVMVGLGSAAWVARSSAPHRSPMPPAPDSVSRDDAPELPGPPAPADAGATEGSVDGAVSDAGGGAGRDEDAAAGGGPAGAAVVDAGVEAAVDAGTPDAGAPQPPKKAAAPKKKRRRR